MTSSCRQPIFLLLISFFLSVFHCADNDISDSGGGIDIGNPTKICVVDSLDKPVAGASVKIIPSGRWFASVFSGNNTVSDSVWTDKSGIVAFDSLTGGSYNLQIDHSRGGAFVTDFHAADSPMVTTIVIGKYAALSGTVSSVSGTPVQIRLAGTAYCAPIDADGSYMLANIARESCIPVIMATDEKWTFAGTIDAASLSAPVNIGGVSFDALSIDDFEDSGSTVKMSGLVHNSFIYANQAGSVNASVNYQVVPGGIGGGKALQGTLIRMGAWALVGFHLGVKPDGDSVWDFSAATGLSFYAKGAGKLNVSIESDTIDRMGFYKHYSADIVLPAAWQQVFISFDSLTFKDDMNPAPDISWKESARSIKRIEFNALEGDTVQFWLDDLKINGVDLSAVY
jgi:hypothetical protein